MVTDVLDLGAWTCAGQRALPRVRAVEQTVHCARCSKPLTDPVSQARRIGPDCWALLHPQAPSRAHDIHPDQTVIDVTLKEPTMPQPSGPTRETLTEALQVVTEGRAHQREHYPSAGEGKYVGHHPAHLYDAAIDIIAEGLAARLDTDTPNAAPGVRCVATEYMVTCVPDDVPQGYVWAVWVHWRGTDRYCVSRGQNQHPNEVWSSVEGDWVWESIPSERRDEFIAATRFSIAEALEIADGLAPNVVVNGYTPQDVIARWENRKRETEGEANR